jgi:hypothetical protein
MDHEALRLRQRPGSIAVHEAITDGDVEHDGLSRGPRDDARSDITQPVGTVGEQRGTGRTLSHASFFSGAGGLCYHA